VEGVLGRHREKGEEVTTPSADLAENGNNGRGDSKLPIKTQYGSLEWGGWRRCRDI